MAKSPTACPRVAEGIPVLVAGNPCLDRECKQPLAGCWGWWRQDSPGRSFPTRGAFLQYRVVAEPHSCSIWAGSAGKC